jgi:hypothetical protein
MSQKILSPPFPPASGQHILLRLKLDPNGPPGGSPGSSPSFWGSTPQARFQDQQLPDLTPLLPSEEAYHRLCHKKSQEIFTKALQKPGVWQPTHPLPVLALVAAICIAAELLRRILLIVSHALQTVRALYRLEGTEAVYHFTCTIFWQPLSTLATAVSGTIRVSTAVLGTASTSIALKGWQAAEKIDITFLNLKISFNELLPFPRKDVVEKPVQPIYAEMYFKPQQHNLFLDPQELSQRESDIRLYIGHCFKHLAENFSSSLDPAIHYSQSREEAPPELRKLFRYIGNRQYPPVRTIKDLPALMLSKFAGTRLPFLFDTDELSDICSYMWDRLPPEAKSQESVLFYHRNIVSLSSRFGFARYRE